jgi:glycosyltransferase involved in cell wall biosynthesis
MNSHTAKPPSPEPLKGLRVCYFGTYRANYSRNQIMIAGLRRVGVEVIECHATLWHGIQDRVQAVSGGWKRPRFWWRVLKTYAGLLRRYRAIGDYDVMVVGYPGQFDVYLARWLARRRGKPLAWDIFMSIYLIADERGLVERHPHIGQWVRRVERRACHLPDRLIMDTAEYVAWFQRTHGITPGRFRLVPTGADDRVFKPVARAPVPEKFTVTYYGTFIPNHGVEHIIEAARLLQDQADIHFELIGQGPRQAALKAKARRYGLDNVSFVGWVDKEDLPGRVARADVCLGAFGTTPQSLMTVQNKIYEGLAMGKPVITGDAPTVRQSLTHSEHVYLCRRADPQDLARAIRALRDDSALRQRLAQSGHARFQADFNLAAIGARFRAHLLELLGERP